MIKFDTYQSGGRTHGRFTLKGVGKIANGIRRILLDEITTIALDVSAAELETEDLTINRSLFINIGLVRIYEEGEFYIKCENNKSTPIVVTSAFIYNLATSAPAKVFGRVELFTLNPGYSCTIKGIKSVRGNGREHVKFSSVMGPVTYLPTDVIHVSYLNERGFIESNLRMIALEKDMDINGRYIIWNKAGEDKISKLGMMTASFLTKLPRTDYKFLTSETHVSNDFIITFYSENPEQTARWAIDTFIGQLEKGKSDDELYTITVADSLKQFIYDEVGCAIFSNEISKNVVRITIDHSDSDKLLENAKQKILTILKSAF